MLRPRVIPVLLLLNGGLVKTTNFKSPKYVGDPINAIKIFNEKNVDEIIVLDIGASINNQGPNYELISKFAGECFMPLCYGGGIQNEEQAKRIFNLGVEKISIQSAAIADMNIISKLAGKFGSQSIVFSLDIQKSIFGNYKIRNYNNKNKDWIDLIKEAQHFGAGEILLNSVDQDGTMRGLDLSLLKQAANNLHVPLIGVGGCKDKKDIQAGLQAGASGIGAGSLFVFHGPHRAVLITYLNEDDFKNL